MKFTKMHGLGNDYVFVDGADRDVADTVSLARAVSDRHTGIGSDGLILIQPSTCADARMEMYNADGSRAEMCGNGIRCVAKYLVDRGRAAATEVRIETDDGVKRMHCELRGSVVHAVRVDMGRPSLLPSSLPSTIPGDSIVDHPLAVGDRTYRITCVSMGNPHAVVFVDDPSTIDLASEGSLIERTPEFPERTNVHFVRVDDAMRVTMRTWERGSGATLACGTGACAAAVAGALTGCTQRRITAALPRWRTEHRLGRRRPRLDDRSCRRGLHRCLALTSLANRLRQDHASTRHPRGPTASILQLEEPTAGCARGIEARYVTPDP